MKILIIGTGYVGTTTGLIFCEMGHQVTGLDLDEDKIKSLQDGKLHFFEPGLEEILIRHVNTGKIIFTNNTEKAIKENDIIIICVGTPQGLEGSVNLSYVKSVAESIGKYMNNYKIIVTKSTVPVGTADLVEKWIKQYQETDISYDVVSNPEFLREGSALEDAINPDRIVIGFSSEKSRKIMQDIYSNFQCPIVYTDTKASELIKYVANSFLALKISYINEISRLCDVLGIDVMKVSEGIGLDRRIGNQFLSAGIGYGGSCFPKDVNALLNTGNQYKVPLNILESSVKINDLQYLLFVEKINSFFSTLKNKKFAVLGLSFKPNTDDVRDSPAIKIVDKLIEMGAIVSVHDPVVKLKKLGVNQGNTIEDTVKEADAIILCTEWKDYKEFDWKSIKKLINSPYIFDGRNMLDSHLLNSQGFIYNGVGR